MNDTDDDQFVDSTGICEVSITDVNDTEHFYWVKIADLNCGLDYEDAAIAAALAFHKRTVGTDMAMDEEFGEKSFVYEPFSRLPREFTWVDISTIKDQGAS
jgi:hypothetical protein